MNESIIRTKTGNRKINFLTESKYRYEFENLIQHNKKFRDIWANDDGTYSETYFIEWVEDYK